MRGQSDSASRIGLGSQFAAPQVAGAIAKIQQALDRSGIQFKVRLEQRKVYLLALGLDFVHTRNGAAVLPDSVISTPSSRLRRGGGGCAIGADRFRNFCRLTANGRE